MRCVAFIVPRVERGANLALVRWCLRWSARRPGRWHKVEMRPNRAGGVRAGIALYEPDPALVLTCAGGSAGVRIVAWPEEARA